MLCLLCRPHTHAHKSTRCKRRYGEDGGQGRRGRIYLVWSTFSLVIHRHRGLVIHHLSPIIHGRGRGCRGRGCTCSCACARGPRISAAPLITGRDCARFWGNRNNKPALIVSRDGQGMSRQSVLAAVPSCCRVTQWSNVEVYGRTSVLGDRDRLAARASPVSQVQAG